MTDVVVLGAGVIGASVAWHLRKLGVREVLLVDRAAGPGESSTGRATGGFRAQFSTAINVRLSLLAREKLLRFRDEIGADPGFAQHGYLFVARSEDALEQLRRAQSVQHECGLTDTRMIDAAEAREINPAIGDDSIVGGAYCPSDGCIRDMPIVDGYIDA